MGANDLYAFNERDFRRLVRVVKSVEAQIKGRNGTSMSKRLASPYSAFVQFDACMHHDKTEKTIAYRVMSNVEGTKDTDITVDKDFEFEVYPGAAKGIWFKGDVCKIEYIRQIWQPVAWGRQYFEATLGSALSAAGNGTVTIAGETITVVEGSFATANLTGKIGIALGHKSFTADQEAGVLWRPIIGKCAS